MHNMHRRAVTTMLLRLFFFYTSLYSYTQIVRPLNTFDWA